MISEVESLRVQSLWVFILMLYACIICLKRVSTLNTRSNDFICTYIEHVTSRKRRNRFVSRCEG